MVQLTAFKSLLLPSIFAFILGCQSPLTEGAIENEIELDNQLGTLTLAVPEEFDSLQSWTRDSDFRCGRQLKHGIFDRDYDVFLDTSYITFDFHPDSLRFIVISQPENTDCKEDTLKIHEVFLESEMAFDRLINPGREFSISEIVKINGLDLAILASEHEVGDLTSSHLKGYLVLSNQLVKINCGCYAKNCNGFIEQMYCSIKTLRHHPAINP